ncbi:hypothetical protein B296_00055639 [Ensete ventricosum]|uniref:Uncharacterized protein n=1 Tax=Ensete ventricosum TaxID=4639 RepID=A0A426XYJ8_ENSVE|nr:hypothetical protein B296_00055639 [Ensete ventricosum]
MTTSWVEEDSEVYVSGGGSCGPLPRRWKELRTKVRLSDQSAGDKGSLGSVRRQRRQVICFQQWISCSATKIASTMWHFFPL